MPLSPGGSGVLGRARVTVHRLARAPATRGIKGCVLHQGQYRIRDLQQRGGPGPQPFRYLITGHARTNLACSKAWSISRQRGM
jgi:hypothetical protein